LEREQRRAEREARGSTAGRVQFASENRRPSPPPSSESIPKSQELQADSELEVARDWGAPPPMPGDFAGRDWGMEEVEHWASTVSAAAAAALRRHEVDGEALAAIPSFEVFQAIVGGPADGPASGTPRGSVTVSDQLELELERREQCATPPAPAAPRRGVVRARARAEARVAGGGARSARWRTGGPARRWGTA
jgi:hypothetical protein